MCPLEGNRARLWHQERASCLAATRHAAGTTSPCTVYVPLQTVPGRGEPAALPPPGIPRGGFHKCQPERPPERGDCCSWEGLKSLWSGAATALQAGHAWRQLRAVPGLLERTASPGRSCWASHLDGSSAPLRSQHKGGTILGKAECLQPLRWTRVNLEPWRNPREEESWLWQGSAQQRHSYCEAEHPRVGTIHVRSCSIRRLGEERALDTLAGARAHLSSGPIPGALPHSSCCPAAQLLTSLHAVRLQLNSLCPLCWTWL